MPSTLTLLTFGLVVLGLALTPGPNMIYIVSRTICQGRTAGLVSFSGIFLGYLFYMSCAAFGITALIFAVPYAYDVLRIGGAIYLLWLAWNAVKPDGRSPFQVQQLPPVSKRKLFTMGLLTNLLNPKMAMIYLSLLPQFINPTRGSVLEQSLALGTTQIMISIPIYMIIISIAGALANFFATKPTFVVLQRWLMGTVLAALAVRLAVESQK